MIRAYFFFLTSLAVCYSAADTEGDNHSSTARENSPRFKATPLWKYPLKGDTYAGIVAYETLVIVSDHEKGKADFWHALDAETGKAKWTYQLENTESMSFGASPRSLPLLLEDRVITMNAWGLVTSLDLQTGAMHWQINLVEEFLPDEVPYWGYSAGLLAYKKYLYINPGGEEGLVALNTTSGDIEWTAKTSQANYATPAIYSIAQTLQLLSYDAESLNAWDPLSGKALWSLPVSSANGYIVPVPTVFESFLLTCDDSNGGALYRFNEAGVPQEIPYDEDNVLYSELTTPHYRQGLVFVASYGLVCAEANSLKTLWIEEKNSSLKSDFLHFMPQDNGQLWIFCGDGTLIIAEPDRNGLNLIGTLKLCEKTYCLPAQIGNRLWVRDKKQAYAFQIEKLQDESAKEVPSLEEIKR